MTPAQDSARAKVGDLVIVEGHRIGEARRIGEQVAGQDRPDPVDRLQGLAALVLAGEATQLGVDAVELRCEELGCRPESQKSNRLGVPQRRGAGIGYMRTKSFVVA